METDALRTPPGPGAPGQSVHGPARGSTTRGERALAPDIARGFMLLLIVLAHAPLYVMTAHPGVLTHPEGGDALDRAITFLGLAGVDNRAYPMFAALFGYGMATLVSRQLAAGSTPRAARRLLTRRGVWLVLFGLVHYILIFPADILGPYGVAALVLGWLFVRGDRALRRGAWIATAVGFALASVFAVALATAEDSHADNPRGTIWAHDYADALGTRAGEALFPDIHVLLGWPVPAAILLGAIAARRHWLDRPADHRTLLRRVAAVGLPVSLAGGVPLALIGSGAWHTSDVTEGLATALHIVTGFAGGLGYAAVFGLIAARRAERGLGAGPAGRALAAVGKRSLTTYLLQSALLALLLSPMALGLGEHIHATGAALTAVAVWAAAGLFANLLEHHGRRGPVDALLRRLVYGRTAAVSTPHPATTSQRRTP
ncbi:DUF418 domain-containing protein [Streptomyces sp. NPDC053367]|uniref:DUF418 domain-containing protein n=1 Tax=Streptomyces sp. NPDC053367 TaxID=3365700 RepID=UPI0037CF9125